MLTTVDRVLARLTLKHPTSDRQSEAVREDVTQFAAQLLDNYKGQLARHSVAPERPAPRTAS